MVSIVCIQYPQQHRGQTWAVRSCQAFEPSTSFCGDRGSAPASAAASRKWIPTDVPQVPTNLPEANMRYKCACSHMPVHTHPHEHENHHTRNHEPTTHAPEEGPHTAAGAPLRGTRGTWRLGRRRRRRWHIVARGGLAANCMAGVRVGTSRVSTGVFQTTPGRRRWSTRHERRRPSGAEAAPDWSNAGVSKTRNDEIAEHQEPATCPTLE